jgi:cell wall-associated NlpC family hydrolase
MLSALRKILPRKILPALVLGPVVLGLTATGPPIAASATELSNRPAKTARSAHAVRVARIHRAVDIGLRQIGDPYVYGATGPGAFDCSGLLYYSYHRAGFPGLPRTSSAQAGWLHPVRKPHMRRGDLMFFYGSGGVYHAAIFLKWRHGRAVMLDAPYPGRRVHRTVPWTTQWFGRTLR